jgi:MFS family permease
LLPMAFSFDPVGRFVTDSLDSREKRTFKLHLAYQSIEGIILGILALNEYVFLKSIKGSGYELGFLFQFSMLVFLFLVIFNEFRKRVRNKRRLLRIAGIVTRLPLLGLFFFPSNEAAYLGSQFYHLVFLGIFLVYYLGNTIIYPSINVLLKTNYRHENFGKLYGYTTSVNKFIMLIATFFYGMLLDFDFYAFRYVFPVIGGLGILSIMVLSNIDFSRTAISTASGSILVSIRNSVRNMVRILVTNKPYRDFEIGFMIYGMAFMMTEPVINLFFNEGLMLNYSSVAFYKNGYNLLAIVLLLFTGRWMGRMDPRKFGAITFLSVLFYLLFMMLTQYLPGYFRFGNITVYYMLALSFMAYGYFAGTMVLLWNIGSAYFCRPEEADDYQANHLFLTGSRAIFAPLMGVWIYKMFGFTGTFNLAIGLLAVAIALMLKSYRSLIPIPKRAKSYFTGSSGSSKRK